VGGLRIVGLIGVGLVFLWSCVNLLVAGLLLAQAGSDSYSLGRFMGRLLFAVVVLAVLSRLWKWRPGSRA
jgi:hypothetical protein